MGDPTIGRINVGCNPGFESGSAIRFPHRIPRHAQPTTIQIPRTIESEISRRHQVGDKLIDVGDESDELKQRAAFLITQAGEQLPEFLDQGGRLLCCANQDFQDVPGSKSR